MKHLFPALACSAAASGAAFAQNATVVTPSPVDTRNLTYAGVYDAVTGTMITSPAEAGPTVDEPIYTNDAPSGFFFDIDGGNTIIDEGRVPGPTSPMVVGTQNSYSLSSLQIAYATDSLDASAGGTGVSFELQIFENYFPCSTPDDTEAPLATIDLAGLPGSMSGSLAAFIVDVDVSGLGICLRSDGRGDYSDGLNDLFGWSLRVTDAGTGTAVGPLIAGDPATFPPGDGTVFQNPGASGTGLGAFDLFRSVGPGGGCFFFGGAPFAQFWLVVRSDLSGDCIGCGIADDRFEDNDDQGSAVPLEFDTYPGLIQEQGDIDDYFQVTVPPDSGFIAEILFSDAVSDLDLILRDAGGTILDTGFSTTDDELCEFGNCSASPVDVFVQVNNFSDLCAEYDLVLELDPLFGDDSLEDNDDCASRVPLPLGVEQGLIVRPYCSTSGGDDGDYFSTTLMPGESLTVDALFDHDIADVDTVLYDVTGGCNGTIVDTGFSTTDNEHMSYTNTGATPVDLAVRVDWFRGRSNSYDLVTKIGPETIGELICIGADNSTGAGARLCATGSEVAADNDVTFEVTQLPLNAMGYFIVSMDTVFVPNPGGSAGNLCIGSFMIGRYAGSVLDSGASGSVMFSPDLTMIPIAGSGGPGTVAAMAGDTFNFQYWTRDMDMLGNATSNFSDAISIGFD